MRGALFSSRYLLIHEQFVSDYLSNVDHFTSPVNADKVDDFAKLYFEQRLAAAKDIYSFDGVDAHIRIEGPMSPNGPDLYDIFYGYGGVAYSDILDAIAQAKTDVDPKQGTLYFHGNTPGGTVSMVDDVWQAISSCGLRTVMLNKGLLASGGMWIGSACEKIVATTPVAFTGSIGVIVRCYDLSGYLEKLGIKQVVITNHAAAEKAPDISTVEGQRVVQEELESIYSIFKQRVSTGRKGKISNDVIDGLKGSVKVASEAVALGLIDYIQDGPSGAQTQHRAQATAEPASKGDHAMNMQQLKADHPDLVAAITAEAREGMVSAEKHNEALSAARTEGAQAERARIADVRAQAIPGYDALIEQLAFDGKSTGADAAMAIVAAEKTARETASGKLDADANNAVPPIDADGDQAKTMKRSEFDALDQNARRAYLSAGGKITD